MIEDKKDGVKVAENKLEAKYNQIADRLKEEIESAKISIELNTVTLKFVEEKLKTF